MTQPSPDELRDMIDGALDEIERTELEMLDMLSELLGPERAQQIAGYIEAELRRASRPELSTPPQAIQ